MSLGGFHSLGRALALGAVLALAAAGAAWAAGPAAGMADSAKKSAAEAGDLAIGGYDPVAYFDKEAETVPLKGLAKYSYEWDGQTWRFASAAHRALFQDGPDKYAPQYGGYSAYEICRGELVPGDPKVYSVVYGKLYLQSSEDVRQKWLAAIVGYIYTADLYWRNRQDKLSEPGAAEPAAAIAAPDTAGDGTAEAVAAPGSADGRPAAETAAAPGAEAADVPVQRPQPKPAPPQ